MTMAISGVSLASSATLQNPNDPRQQFLQLARAISSGNLSGAQQAFANLSQTLGNGANGGDSGNPSDPVSQALAAIGQALQSGDIGAAQQALASLQQAHGARGHHHHHGGQGSNAGPDDGAPPSGSSAPAPAAPTTGTSLDVTA
jgi:hypothetical protein